MKNKELAEIFSKIADALEIKGETGFKVIAYRKATRILEDLTEDIELLSKEGRLREIPGIGSGIAQKIEEYIKTTHMKKFDEALSDIPPGLLELLNIQNLGAKTIHIAHKQYAVKNLEDLKRVIDDGSLAQAYGLGEKKVENIRKGVEIFELAQERMPISEALYIAEEVIDYLRKAPHIGRISPAGSLRRMRETVGDIDILATGKQGTQIIRYFTQFPGSTRTLVAGKAKGSIMIDAKGVECQVDLRIVDESEYGAALQYFSGSKAHNIKLRTLAKEAGLKVSEYGVFKGKKKIAGFDEEEVYRALGLPVIPPELREDRGEVELALQNKLPRIVELSDIRGDLHVHSNYSDGSLSIKELAEMAKELGYEYVAVCDHSQVVRYANGLTLDRLRKQVKEIDRLNREIKGIKILKGSEVDILQDGRLDFPDEILKGHFDRFIAHKVYGNHILRAVYEYDNLTPVLVALYFPFAKIYFQGGGEYENKIFN